MSSRWPGSLINKTAPTPSGGGAQDSAPGVWTLDQANPYIASQTWPGTGVPDPQFQYVTALLHGDGTNAAQNNTFLDSSTNNFTITRNGNTTQGSFSPYGSLWSNYFNSSNSSYLSVPDSSALELGTNSFTMEAWVFLTSFASPNCILAKMTSASYPYGFLLLVDTSGVPKFYMASNSGAGSSWDIVSSLGTIALSTNTWNHVVVGRSGSTFRMWINGSSSGTATNSGSMNDNSAPVFIGAAGQSATVSYANGYISNTRIVNGTDVYGVSNSTITVPTTPLTAITNTALLTCQSNRFIDNSSNAFAITVNGSPSVQRFSPFQNLATYQTAKIGGSGYFDGSTDYLTLPNNAAFNFGTPSGTTNDFTLEAWIYPVAFNTAAGIMGSFNDASQTGYRFVLDNTGALRVNIGSSFNLTSSSLIVSLNQWHHVAATRTSNNVYIYHNGTQVASGTTSNAADAPSNFLVGRNAVDVNNWYFPGYISNTRVLKGIAQYTGSTYTVPTTPFTAISGTSLLTSMTNGAIYDNAMMNDLQTVGSAQISTSVVKYGTGSMYFGGVGNYLKAPATPSNSLGSANFTVEMWVYPTANAPIYDAVMVARGSPTTTGNYSFALLGSGTLNAPFVAALNGIIAQSSVALTLNTWSHVAYSRIGNTWLIFVNGNLTGSATNSTTFTDNTNDAMYVGVSSYDQTSNRTFTGYIDDLRITKGYARYWFNFQPPSAPYPNYGGTLQLTYDPYFSNTTLLLNGDGTNGAQNNTFLDSSTNNFTITRNGNTTQGSFSPYGNLWSTYLNGSSNLYTPSSSSFAFSGQYTVSFWAYITSTPADYSAVFSVTTTNGLQIGFDTSTGNFGVARFNIAWDLLTPAFTQNQWVHVAVTRDSSNLTRIFYNGSLQASATLSTSYTQSNAYVGRGNSSNLPGYISNLQVLNGTCLYASNFTPPTAPATAVTNTVLLTCQSNRFIDNSSNAFALTANGSPSVQRFSPFNPTAPYSTSVIGGSGYFDGSSAYLTTPTNSALAFGTGDFTFNVWLYPLSWAGSYQPIVTGGPSAFQLYNTGSGINLSCANVQSIFTSSSLPQTNAWTYLTVSRVSGTTKMFFNGVQVASASDGNNYSTTPLTIGGQSGYCFNGYFTDFQFVKGSGVTSVTIPTLPATAITNTQLLLSYTNAGIPDLAMQNNLQTVGNAQVSTAQYKYGSSSLSFTSSGDYLVSTRSQVIPAGPFTIEAWAYTTSSSQTQAIFAQGTGTGDSARAFLGIESNSGAYWTCQIGGTQAISNIAVVQNTWTHVAMTWDGSTMRLWVNGNLAASASSSTSASNTTLQVGKNWGSYQWIGYIDDARVSSFLRYVQPFTPPTAALPTY
jgi:hypothetical protein